MKRNVLRRFLALTLSVAMVFSMFCTAFATEAVTTSTDPFDFSDIEEEESEVEAEESETEAEESETEAEESEVEAEESEAEAEESEAEAIAEESNGEATVIQSSGLIYVDSSLYSGYYMDDDGLMYLVADGVAALFSGYLKSGVNYYKKGAGYVTLAKGVVYINGALLTGYFYNTSLSKMHTCTNGVYTVTNGVLAAGTEYYLSDGTSATLESATTYVSGYVYAGSYYMDSEGIMYLVSDTGSAIYTGILSSGTSYWDAASKKTCTTSGKRLYVNGTLLTGYYYSTKLGKMHTCTNGVYKTTSDYLPKGTKYYLSDGTSTTSTAGCVYVSGYPYTGYFLSATQSNRMYYCKNGAYTLYTGVLKAGTEYYKNGSGKTSLESSVVYIKGVLLTGYYYNTKLGKMHTCTNGVYKTTSDYLPKGTKYYLSDGTSTTSTAGCVYVSGYPYTGYFLSATQSNRMYYCKNGAYTLYTGVLKAETEYYKNGSGKTSLESSVVYIKGVLLTGYYYNTKLGKMHTCTNGVYKTTSDFLPKGTKYYLSDGTSTTSTAGCVYVSGYPYTGYFLNATLNDKMYYCSNGTYTLYTGTLSAGTKYYMNGTGYQTLSDATTYTKGVSEGAWKFSNNYAYYYVGGKKVTGWYYIKRNGTTYKYYFDPDDGHLVTNLYAYFGSSYKYKKCKLVVNKTTHNASLLGYDTATDSYCIPYYSFIVSTAKKTANTPTGTYALSSNYHRKWFTFIDEDNDNKEYYYAYATLISGSGCWFHSEYYTVYGSLNSLSASTYNGLGTNQTSYCVRAQLYVAKLVYDIRDCYSGSIKVEIVANSVNGPFGKITLSSTTGKISSSTKVDPTDSSSYKGYIKQTAE